MTSREKSIISFQVDADLKAALQALANADQRPLSAYIKIVLREHVAEHGKGAPRARSKTKGKD